MGPLNSRGVPKMHTLQLVNIAYPVLLSQITNLGHHCRLQVPCQKLLGSGAHTLPSLFWRLTIAICVEITLVGGGRLSSSSSKEWLALTGSSMRVCQVTPHVCTVHNREEGTLLL